MTLTEHNFYLFAGILMVFAISNVPIADGQMDPELARQKYLAKQGERSAEDAEYKPLDLTKYDSDTLRQLAQNLHRYVYDLEQKLNVLESTIQEPQEHVETLLQERQELLYEIYDLTNKLEAMHKAMANYPTDITVRGSEHKDSPSDGEGVKEGRPLRIYASLQEILDGIPADVYPPKGEQWDSRIHGRLANKWLRKNVNGSRYKATVPYQPPQVISEDVVSELAFTGQAGALHGMTVRSAIYAQIKGLISLSEIAKFRLGMPLAIEGTIANINLSGGNGVFLPCTFKLDDTEVQYKRDSVK